MDFVRALRVFLRVVEAGSFAHAAEQLGTSGAAASRQIAALENHLQVRLLHRTTRKLSLTTSGEVFLEKARHIVAAIEQAEGFGAATPEAVSGTLRIAAPLSFGLAALGPVLAGFRQRYPRLRLDLDLSDRVVDLSAHGFDVALRISRDPSPQLVARRIAPVNLVPCASPEYLRLRGTPKHPSDLAKHETLSYSLLSCGETWPFTNPNGELIQVRIAPCVSATNGDVLRDIAVAGGGVIVQPTFIVEREVAAGRLVPLLPGWTLPQFHLYAVYLTHRQLSAKVRLFVDYLVERMGAHAATPLEEPPVRSRLNVRACSPL